MQLEPERRRFYAAAGLVRERPVEIELSAVVRLPAVLMRCRLD